MSICMCGHPEHYHEEGWMCDGPDCPCGEYEERPPDWSDDDWFDDKDDDE